MTFHSKVLIALLFLILLNADIFCEIENSDDSKLIKRTIAILPFYNLKKDKNDFYSNLLRDALKSRLMEKEIFNLVEFGEINETLLNSNFNLYDINTNEKKSSNFAGILKADIAIFGTFAVEKENIIISITAYDIIFNKTIVTVTEDSDTGLNLFNLINVKIASNLADKMSKETPKIDQSILNELKNRYSYKIEEEDKTIIAKLLEEKEKYLRYDINLKGANFPLAIPRGYNVIIFMRDAPGVFKIKYNNEIFLSAPNGIKIMVLDNTIGARKEFTIMKDNLEIEKYNYVQKKDSEIMIKSVRFKDDNIKFSLIKNEKNFIVSSSAFAGISGLFFTFGGITSGITGYFIYLYYTIPIEEIEKIIEYKNTVYTLFPISIVFFSITAAFLVPFFVLIGLYGYCRQLKEKEAKKVITFEPYFENNITGAALIIRL